MPTGITITRFSGEAPRFATELIPQGYAKYASNVKLTSGDLVPYHYPEALIPESVTGTTSIYPMVSGNTFFWLSWANDVDVAKAAVVDDSNSQRIYYTGDGVPKVTDFNRATLGTVLSKAANYTLLAADQFKTVECSAAPWTLSLPAVSSVNQAFVFGVSNISGAGDITVDPSGAELINGAATLTVSPGQFYKIRRNGTGWAATVPTAYPYDYLDLGLPAPSSAPTTAFDTLTKSGAYTAVAGDSGKTLDCSSTPWTLSLTAAATLGVDWLLVIRNLGTGDLTVDPNGSELINSNTNLVIKSGEVGLITCNGTAFSGVTTPGLFKAYVYTYVSAFGEEGTPSPPSDFLLLTSGQRVNVTGLPSAAPSGNYDITKVRLYRTNSASAVTTFQFVTELDIGTTSYTDTVTDDLLGEVLPSTSWAAPPSELKGIVSMANGMMAGFKGNQIYFCEPYEPYAWPEEYKLTVDYPIVAVGAVGNSLIITTEGTPYIASGNHPETTSLSKLDVPYPNLSKRSLVSMGTGIMYASFEGLVFCSGNSATLVSNQLFTRSEWKNYFPDTIVAKFYDGKYFASYTDDSSAERSFVFQAEQGGIGKLIRSDISFKGGFSDLKTGEFYFIRDAFLWKWDSVSQELQRFLWQSKDFMLPKPVNFGAAKVEADFPANVDPEAIIAANDALSETEGELNAVDINTHAVNDSLMQGLEGALLFRVYVNKSLYWQRYVGNEKTFRLPGGFKHDCWSFSVEADFPVHGILVAETPTELEVLDVA